MHEDVIRSHGDQSINDLNWDNQRTIYTRCITRAEEGDGETGWHIHKYNNTHRDLCLHVCVNDFKLSLPWSLWNDVGFYNLICNQ